MSIAASMEAHSSVDNTPCDNGIDAWKRLVHSFDPTSAQANLNLTIQIVKPPTRNIENAYFVAGEWEEMVRRQDERTGRQALPTTARWPFSLTCALRGLEGS